VNNNKLLTAVGSQFQVTVGSWPLTWHRFVVLEIGCLALSVEQRDGSLLLTSWRRHEWHGVVGRFNTKESAHIGDFLGVRNWDASVSAGAGKMLRKT